MKFQKGQSGNPEGRPKGAKNKITLDVKEKIESLVLDNWDQFKEDVKKMKAKDRAAILMKALEWIIPKLKSIEIDAKVENDNGLPHLTPEQIDRLIEKL